VGEGIAVVVAAVLMQEMVGVAMLPVPVGCQRVEIHNDPRRRRTRMRICCAALVVEPLLLLLPWCCSQRVMMLKLKTLAAASLLLGWWLGSVLGALPNALRRGCRPAIAGSTTPFPCLCCC